MKRLVVADESISCSQEQLPGALIVPFNFYDLPRVATCDLYDFLEKTKKKNLPTSASISGRKLYRIVKEKRKSEQEILFISLAKELSKTAETFEEVASMFRKEKIDARVFDSGQAFASLYFFVDEALRNDGNLDETIDELETKKEDIFLFATLNLKYIVRIGRVKGAKKFGTRLLDFLGFLPIFLVKDGEVKKFKITKRKNAAKNLVGLFKARIGCKETFRINFCYAKENKITEEIKKILKEATYDYIESKINRVVAIDAGPQTIGFAFERSGYEFIDGEVLVKALQKFYEKIKKQRGILNLLNLFPVIDSDTGNNLEKTLRPIRKIEKKNMKELLGDISELTDENASGYSGTCMNAFFYGLFVGYKKLKGGENLTRNDLVPMLKEAKEHTYLSFKKVNPVEGTILTVIRKTYETFKESETNKIERIFVEAYKRCVDELINPSVRPEILRKKNVIDSGALGFSYFLESFVEVLGRAQEIEEARKKLQETTKKHRMYLYYRPKEAKTKGFCLELRVNSKELPKIIEKLDAEEISISQKKDYSLVHLHALPEEREKVIDLMENYDLINQTPLSQPWYVLLKNQLLMVGEKIRLIPSFLMWTFYWPGLRIIWPFREMKLARRYKEYRVVVKGLENLIDMDFAIIVSSKSHSRGFAEEELLEIKEKIERNQAEEYILKIKNKSYKIEAIKENERVIGQLVTRESQIGSVL